MCGIVGYWNLGDTPMPEKAFEAFTDTVEHRGPGSRGVWHDRKIGLSLGHRRLAVFDLSDKGRQPMQYENGRYWITFNGEIFNFLELKEELGKEGYKFQSTCDTEVILAAYAKWGEDCLYHFNGAWAFGIWDTQKKTLFLARDHFGVKPFHYIHTDEYFAFASEMKSFLAIPHFQVEFDEDIVAENLTNVNGLESTKYTLLKGVHRLRDGHCMTITPDGKAVERQWWHTIDHLPEIPVTEEEQVHRFKELLTDSCAIRLRSDLPMVTTLSGGLDSSAVAAVVAEIVKKEGTPGHFESAYVASFPGTNQEETAEAMAVADYLGIPLQKRVIDMNMNIESMVDELIWGFEDIYWVLPVALWRIFKDMGRGKYGVVALDGSGGDDITASQRHMIYDDMEAALFRLDIRRYRELQAILLSFKGGSVDTIPEGVWYVLKRAWLKTRFAQQHLLWALSKAVTIPAWSFLKRKPKKFRLYADYKFKKPAGFTPLQHSQYIWEHFTGMLGVDRTYDRAAAAHGVSLRSPLLDYRLVTYTLALPDQMKLGHGQYKYILREAMKGMMPEHIRVRTNKIGFTSPMGLWFQGPLKAWLEATINNPDFLGSRIWDGAKVRGYVMQCMDRGKWEEVANLWPIFNAFHTMRLFKQRGPTKP